LPACAILPGKPDDPGSVRCTHGVIADIQSAGAVFFYMNDRDSPGAVQLLEVPVLAGRDGRGQEHDGQDGGAFHGSSLSLNHNLVDARRLTLTAGRPRDEVDARGQMPDVVGAGHKLCDLSTRGIQKCECRMSNSRRW